MHSGFVAILGRPNAGKSSFVNQVVGMQLSAVSPRPQTTWHQIRAILSDERGQIIFIDTPGIHVADSRLNKALVANAVDAAMGADAVLLLIDASDIRQLDWQLLRELSASKKLLVGLNKQDRCERIRIQQLLTKIKSYGAQALPLSVKYNENVAAIVERLFALLPEGPYLYNPDDLSDRSMRFVVTEYVRQAIFEQLDQELPYEIFVEVESYQEQKKPLHIEANIFVSRDSQKQIVIGKGGKQLKAIGARARQLIESSLGRQVYLQLWVKVLPKWHKNEHQLRRAGVLLGAKQLKRVEAKAKDWQLHPQTAVAKQQANVANQD